MGLMDPLLKKGEASDRSSPLVWLLALSNLRSIKLLIMNFNHMLYLDYTLAKFECQIPLMVVLKWTVVFTQVVVAPR